MSLALHEANSMLWNVELGRGSVEFGEGDGGECLVIGKKVGGDAEGGVRS